MKVSEQNTICRIRALNTLAPKIFGLACGVTCFAYWFIAEIFKTLDNWGPILRRKVERRIRLCPYEQNVTFFHGSDFINDTKSCSCSAHTSAYIWSDPHIYSQIILILAGPPSQQPRESQSIYQSHSYFLHSRCPSI